MREDAKHLNVELAIQRRSAWSAAEAGLQRVVATAAPRTSTWLDEDCDPRVEYGMDARPLHEMREVDWAPDGHLERLDRGIAAVAAVALIGSVVVFAIIERDFYAVSVDLRGRCPQREPRRGAILDAPLGNSLTILIDLLWLLRMLQVVPTQPRQQLHHKHRAKAPQPRRLERRKDEEHSRERESYTCHGLKWEQGCGAQSARRSGRLLREVDIVARLRRK